MKAADATAKVFVTAFEALPKAEREAVLRQLLAIPALREDLIDVALWQKRRRERALSYESVRRKLKKAGRL
jgi:hypothetical protein